MSKIQKIMNSFPSMMEVEDEIKKNQMVFIQMFNITSKSNKYDKLIPQEEKKQIGKFYDHFQIFNTKLKKKIMIVSAYCEPDDAFMCLKGWIRAEQLYNTDCVSYYKII